MQTNFEFSVSNGRRWRFTVNGYVPVFHGMNIIITKNLTLCVSYICFDIETQTLMAFADDLVSEDTEAEIGYNFFCSKGWKKIHSSLREEQREKLYG